MGEIKKILKRFEFEKVCEQIIASPYNEYVQIEKNENDMHPSGRVSLDEDPKDAKLCRSKHK